ncbi:hypothetical protein [Bradyrhizobium sp. USDA 4503]
MSSNDLVPSLILYVCYPSQICVRQVVMIIFDRLPSAGCRPLHILIVVVGADAVSPLRNAQRFCQDIYEFWRSQDDAVLANRMSVGTIDLLASDSGQLGNAVQIRRPTDTVTVERPSCANVVAAIQRWSDLVAKSGAGVIHWVGHGQFRGQESEGAQILFTDDLVGAVRNGINWSMTIHGINGKTRGNPVYCFVDCCRTTPKGPISWYPHGLGLQPVAISFKESALVYGVGEGGQGLWDDAVHQNDRAATLHFKGGPLATGAFLKCFEGIAAEYVAGRSWHDIRISRMEDGARGLACRWMHAIGFAPLTDEQRREAICVDYSGAHPTMMRTLKPQSVLDVRAAGATHCSLSPVPSGHSVVGTLVPNSNPSQFEFIVDCGDYTADVTNGTGTFSMQLSETISIPHQQVDV